MGMIEDYSNMTPVLEVQNPRDLHRLKFDTALRKYVNWFDVSCVQIVSEVKNCYPVFAKAHAMIESDPHLKGKIKIMPCFELRRDGADLTDPAPWAEAGKAMRSLPFVGITTYALDLQGLIERQMPKGKGVGLDSAQTDAISQFAKLLPEGEVWVYPGIESTDLGQSWDSGNELRQLMLWSNFRRGMNKNQTLRVTRSRFERPRSFQPDQTSAQRAIDLLLAQYDIYSAWRVFCVCYPTDCDAGDDPRYWTMREVPRVLDDIDSHYPSQPVELYTGAGYDRFDKTPNEMRTAIESWSQ
jgi:hypothetical protein